MPDYQNRSYGASIDTSELSNGAVTYPKLNSNIVGIDTTSGKINDINSTNFKSLDGANLTRITNLIEGLTPTASGTWDTIPPNLTNFSDNSVSTFAGTGSNSINSPSINQHKIGYVNFDLSTTYNIKVLYWVFYQDMDNVGCTQTYTIQYSLNNSDWTDFYSHGTGTSETELKSLLGLFQARYIRFKCDTTNASVTNVNITGTSKFYYLCAEKC